MRFQETKRGRPKKVEEGQALTFWLGRRHRQALNRFRAAEGLDSPSDALRLLLDLVAETEGSETLNPPPPSQEILAP